MSDHYVHEALTINPAYAGSQDALSISILYRNSWVGFEGSPKTMSMSIHAPIHNEKVGIGFLILNDKIGVDKETDFVGNYAYRMDLGYGKLAFGLGIAMTLRSTDWTKLAAQDANDELLANNSSTGVMPNFSTGIYYSTKKYFIGLSVPLFLSHEYDPQKGKYLTRNDFAAYNYFCNTGYLMNIGPDVRFFPSFLFKYHKGNAPQVDINSQIILRNKVWLGATYRSKNGMVGMLQYQVNNQFRIAYSYDFIVGKDALYRYNSHEIMLHYVFNYKAEVAGPRQF
jgi:type IX secretion system PorP/SprF family membrane protein